MKKILESAEWILQQLEAAGHEAWCVGGCVRDRLLDREPGDWDVTTSALPEETQRVFGERAIPTGLRHGTITVRTEAGPVEVTTFRVDGVYLDHRRPQQVQFTRSLDEDLRRRDFTINAMAFNRNGQLRDPFGGQEDLKNRLLRCVGDPDCRFEEDALRILRGLRFSAVLGFQLEERTAEAIRRNRNLLKEIAAERIWAEMKKLICGDHAAEVLRTYPEVFGVFWPELMDMVGFDQKNPHHIYDVWEHTLHALDFIPAESELRFAILLHDAAKPSCFTLDEKGCGHFYGHPEQGAKLADRLLSRLCCEKELRLGVVQLIAWHDRKIPRTDAGIRQALRQLGEKRLRQLLAVKRADNLAQAPAFLWVQEEIEKAEQILDRLLQEGACVSLRQLALKGNDLLMLGLTGPEVGTVLEKLLDGVVEGNLQNKREVLLDAAKKMKESECSS